MQHLVPARKLGHKKEDKVKKIMISRICILAQSIDILKYFIILDFICVKNNVVGETEIKRLLKTCVYFIKYWKKNNHTFTRFSN